MELAGQLIASQGGLRRLAQAPPHELVGLLGVGPAKAARVAAAFQLARCALADEQPARRTDRSLLHVRDVLGAVLATGGASFAVAHNHPSGDPTPSIFSTTWW